MATIKNDRDVLLQATSPRYANSSACMLLITADTPVFHVATGGAGTPTVVNLTANLISIPGTVTWSVVGASSVTPSGNICTLAFTNMTAASATVTATITYNTVVYTDSKVITKVVDGATGTTGSFGMDGTKAITLNAFQWSNTGAGARTQAFTFTWSGAGVSAYPSGWSASASASPGTGYTLYMISLIVTDTAAATSTAANWSGATSGSIGYRQDGSIGPTGSPGAAGATGQSARVAYIVTTSSSPPGTPSPGSGDVAPSGWSYTATSLLSAGQFMYQSDGLYTSGGNVAWGVPYLSNLKVGSLQALSADLGVVGISTTGSLSSAGKTYGSATAGFFLGYSSSAYQFDIGNSTHYMRWDGSAMSFSGDVVTTGHVYAAGAYADPSGQYGAIVGVANSAGAYFGVVGNGGTVNGSGGVFGTTGSSGSVTGVTGMTFSNSGIGVFAGSGFTAGTALVASSVGGVAIQTYGVCNFGGTVTLTSGNLVISTGSITASAGNVTAYSDDRLKDRGPRITAALEKVCSLDAFYYQSNEQAKSIQKGRDGRQVGLSAQQVQRILPEVVFDGEDGYLTLDYSRMVPLLVNSIKELSAKVDAL